MRTSKDMLRGLGSAALLALVLLPAGARAQGPARPAKPVSLVIDTGAAFVHEPGFGHGFRYGVGVFFKTAKRAAFEIVLERFNVPVEEGAGRGGADLVGLTAGRMDLTAVVFSQHLYILTRGAIQPFATIGVAFDLIHFAADDAAAMPQRDIVDRLALQLGGGADFRVSRRLALTGRARYNMAKTWITDLPHPDPIREVDPLAQNMLNLFGLELSVGIKVTF
ncbi:MAG TPA: hypothetical protein VLJ16_00810 [Acidobacteriota bacterium]|nr:hypothetical protein [Acidobacteriota bacterium]